MSHYSITVPADNPEAIRAAAEFFADRCGCLVEPKPQQDKGYTDVTSLRHLAFPHLDSTKTTGQGLSNEALDEVNAAGQIFKAGPGPVVLTVPKPETDDGSPPPLPPVMTTAGGIVPPPPATPPTTVELADGIPWDERIHSGSRTRMKAAPQGWKPKKQPSEYTTKEAWLQRVSEVEAELRAAMAVPAPPAHPAPPEAMAVPPTHPAPPVSPTLTYAGLTEKITQAGIMPDAVQKALGEIGLTSYAVLAARPDLIPQMAQLLGQPL
jgi:hypothetical protein